VGPHRSLQRLDTAHSYTDDTMDANRLGRGDGVGARINRLDIVWTPQTVSRLFEIGPSDQAMQWNGSSSFSTCSGAFAETAMKTLKP
jgi:hypothetical protein